MGSGRERSCPELDGVDHEQSGCDLVWNIALETENGIVLTRQETLVAPAS
jgi:hypothetical protein